MATEHSLRIEKLYHEAREHPPGEHVAFLEQACADDAPLRHQVQALLAEDAGIEGFLELPALPSMATVLGEHAHPSLIGRRIGSYKILSLLGTGGMGAVYRAIDAKLGREVAFKVLPAAFARDPERFARFRREARLLASLNHSNVAAIHGMEECDGLCYLVMELVPGKTLEGAGPLPLDETLMICRQIAEGLEEAHRKSITHRDIKPSNIKVTAEGLVKILDFGLARALTSEQVQVSSSGSPTERMAATQAGQILGTPDYMSPEQMRGKTVGKQSDIWAFGCLMYELLTGKCVFHGETLADTISKVLKHEPDWQALPSFTPEKVRELLRRCLEKDPRYRLQDIGDARIEIEEALSALGTTSSEPTADVVQPSAADRVHAPRTWAVLAGLACLVAVISNMVTWHLKPAPLSPPLSVNRFTVALPAGEQSAEPDELAAALSPDVRFSPDGHWLAYVSDESGRYEVYVQTFPNPGGKWRISNDGGTEPAWSPAGRELFYRQGSKMMVVDVMTQGSFSAGKPKMLFERPYVPARVD
jgi:serine/threonine protein kinase